MLLLIGYRSAVALRYLLFVSDLYKSKVGAAYRGVGWRHVPLWVLCAGWVGCGSLVSVTVSYFGLLLLPWWTARARACWH